MKKISSFLANLFTKEKVIIGNQIWMMKNLDVDKFRNGDPIPKAGYDIAWVEAFDNEQPAWCYYDDNTKNEERYGKLYNWYAVNDPRGLAPEGWHVPSDAEWTQLTNYLGGHELADKKMKSTSGWRGIRRNIYNLKFEGYEYGGTNKSGFNALPGGERLRPPFLGIGISSGWWSSTEFNAHDARFRIIGDTFLAFRKDGRDGLHESRKEFGKYVRCLSD